MASTSETRAFAALCGVARPLNGQWPQSPLRSPRVFRELPKANTRFSLGARICNCFESPRSTAKGFSNRSTPGPSAVRKLATLRGTDVTWREIPLPTTKRPGSPHRGTYRTCLRSLGCIVAIPSFCDFGGDVRDGTAHRTFGNVETPEPGLPWHIQRNAKGAHLCSTRYGFGVPQTSPWMYAPPAITFW